MTPQVRSEPGWFVSGRSQLFGWLHLPSSGDVIGGVVLCQPFIAEYYSAHRTFRLLADRLAAMGFAVLRFDYTGTGDSSGKPEDVDHVSIWQDDVMAACARLRGGGVPWLAIVAMRAAANMVASMPHPTADAHVLWDPALSGRAFVRQASLLHRAVLAGADDWSQAVSTARGPKPSDPLGFPYPPTFTGSLESVSGTVAGATPTLLLTRDGKHHRAAAKGPHVMVSRALGQRELLEVPPGVARVPTQSMNDIVHWLVHQAGGSPTSHFDGGLANEWYGPHCIERVTSFGSDHAGPFAITTEPSEHPTSDPATDTDRKALTCLMLNAGVLTHIGPHRLYVDLARELAAGSVRSVRLDFRGLGDSPPRDPARRDEPLAAFSDEALEDLDRIITSLPTKSVAALGLCSGGYHTLEAAARHPLAGALAVNLGAQFANHSARQGLTGRLARPVAATAADRPWLRVARRTRVARGLVARLPGPAWWILDRLRIQPDLVRALALARRHGADVAVLLERRRLAEPRLWPLVHRQPPPIKLGFTDWDHALWDSDGRRRVAESCRETVFGWRDDLLRSTQPLADVELAHSRSAPSPRLGLGGRSEERSDPTDLLVSAPSSQVSP